MFGRLFLPFLLVAAAFARDNLENWLELRSPHFTVVSNASEKQARSVADQFERMRAVFQKAFPRLQVDSGSPIAVIAVKNEKDFRALEPEEYLAKGQLKPAGLFLRTPEKNLVLLRLDAGWKHPFAVVYHQYTHFLTRTAEEWMPLCLNEGLAEFYQNTEIRDKDAVLGQPSTENLNLLGQNRLLPLSTLFAVDRTSPYYHEENKGSIFYAESWALTHYLVIKDFHENTMKIADYMVLVSQKVDPLTAAARTFGDLNVLQTTLEKYVRQSSFGALLLSGRVTVNDAEFKARPLTATEANAVRAEFLACNRRDADARALLEAVLRDDPNNVSAHETMGYLEFRQKRLEDARKWYEKAVKLDSQSYLANYYFAAIAMSGGHLEPEDKTRIESSLRTAIKLNPSFAPAHDRLAVFFGMQRQNLEEAHMSSIRVVALDPSNVGYRLNCANILMASDRSKDAVAVLQNAMKVAKSPEEIARVQNALQMVEQYRAAQERWEKQSHGKGEVGTSETKAIADRVAETNQESAAPTLGGAAESFPRGPHRTMTGTIKQVKCSSPARMELKLESRDGTVLLLYANNYYKIQFSALDFTPAGELHPCSDLEGKSARVEFIESSGRTSPGQITSVELRK